MCQNTAGTRNKTMASDQGEKVMGGEVKASDTDEPQWTGRVTGLSALRLRHAGSCETEARERAVDRGAGAWV